MQTRLATRIVAFAAILTLVCEVHAQQRLQLNRPVRLRLAQGTSGSLEPAGSSEAKLVHEGRIAFEASCVDCHDAERALNKTKSFNEWMATIVEMAALEDADIPKQSFRAIATYLTAEASKKPATESAQSGDMNGSNAPSNSDSIEQGRKAFNASCLDCHDGERSLSKSKSFAQWMTTIRRMAAMEDADIAESDFELIATYLTAGASGDSNRTMNDGSSAGKNVNEGGEPSGADSALIEQGRTAFNASCLQCHDAQRSTSKSKSFSGWMATIRRMAAMDGAQVASQDFRSIATYLTSLHSDDAPTSRDETQGLGSNWSFSATTSTVWRGSSDEIENPGFFIDAWMSADWQGDGPLRAKITTCTSCHSDRNSSSGFTFELVEASATLDLLTLLKSSTHKKANPQTIVQEKCPVAAEVKVGRFVVPFGAFATMSHPGSYRTVSNPLMYDMGRRAFVDRQFQPILMAPFSDEGVNFGLSVSPGDGWRARLDFFAVNGLQGNAGGINFNASRSYTDNNRSPDYGGRITVGNQKIRLGLSAMTGSIADEGSSPIDYQLFGWDATVRFRDKMRFYFEYALRNELSETFSQRDDITSGYVAEADLKLCEPISFLARYDNLEHDLQTGESNIDRFTWGPILSLSGGSLLILNHEHWIRTDATDVDVVALRWTATF